jgi:hypothetical protein
MVGSAVPDEMSQQAPRMLAMSTSAFMVSFAARLGVTEAPPWAIELKRSQARACQEQE